MALTTFADVLADERVAEILSGEYLQLAADRNALMNHPALYYAANLARSSSLTAKVSIVGIDGSDLLAPVGDGASIVPITMVDQSFTVTAARQGKAYEPTDAVRFTDGLGVFNAPRLAQDGFMSLQLRLTDMIARLVGGFGRAAATTTGANLTVATALVAVADLEIGSKRSFNGGDVLGILHTQQMADLRDSIALNTAGALQWNAPPEQLILRGNGYRGTYLGIDWFSSDFVPTANAGADRAGGIFCRGGIAWVDVDVIAENSDAISIASKLLFELDREALAGTTRYVSSGFLGVTRGYDTAPHQLGASIITDA